jgi:hypothetical protein
MFKKTAACLTLAAFLAASNACMMWGTRGIETAAKYPKQDRKIFSLVKKSGETVLFSASAPGRVRGDSIVGAALSWENVEIRKPVAVVKKRNDGSVYEIHTSDGRIIPVGKVLFDDADKIVIVAGDAKVTPVTVPLSEVASIKVRKFSYLKTGLVFAAICGVGAAILVQYYRNWE